jgi:DNA-binding CsgD family transcriptional regulator/tetratricopeptide (TPR) repeat protein
MDATDEGGFVGRRLMSPAMVGRDREQDLLVEFLAHPGPASPTAVVVRGEAGIGKTRLLDAVADRASSRARVLRGACLETDAVMPYAPVLDVLDVVVDQVGVDGLRAVAGDGWPALATVVPQMRESPDGQHGDDVDQRRLFRAIVVALRSLAGARPLALLLEDLHWADRSTLDLVTFVVHHVVDDPIVVVATVRDEDVPKGGPVAGMLDGLLRSRLAVEVSLVRLSRTDTAALAAAITGAGLDRRSLDLLHDRSGGNPLLVEEVLAADFEGSDAAHLRALLLRRVASLGEQARHVVRTAAVAGRSCRQVPLVAVAVATRPGLDEARATRAVREALDRGALVPGPAGDSVSFRHALVREAVEAELLAPERQALHEGWARLLEDSPDADPGRLAHHWAEAGSPDRALAAAWRAMQAAERMPANAAASDHVEHVLDLWDRAPTAVDELALDRAAVVERAARLAELAGFASRAAQRYREAIALLDEAREPRRVGVLSARLSRMALVGRGDDALAAARRACRLVPADPPSIDRVDVLARALYVFALTQADEVADTARAVMAAAEATGDDRGRAIALAFAPAVLVDVGELSVDRAVRLLERGRGLAHGVGDAQTEARTCINLSHELLRDGAPSAALQVAIAGMDLAAEAGLRGSGLGGLLLGNALEAAIEDGDWERADALAQRRGWVARDSSGRAIRELTALLALHRGDVRRARRTLQAVVAEVGERPDPESLRIHVEVEAGLHAGAGDPAGALAVAERSLETAEAIGDAEAIPAILAIGLAAAADLRGRVVRVDPGLDRRVDAAAARLAAVPPPPRRMGLAYLATARAELARYHRADDVVEAWLRTVTAWDELAMPLRGAHARWRLAEALLAAAAPRAEVEAVVRPAVETATLLGAAPLAEELVALATRARLDVAAGPDPAPAPPSPLDELGLTPREEEVLLLLAQGLTNRQIGDRLYVTESTAGVHVSNILRKLDVGNRVEAAAIAHLLAPEATAPPGHGRRGTAD